jgi:hypothetical protein
MREYTNSLPSDAPLSDWKATYAGRTHYFDGMTYENARRELRRRLLATHEESLASKFRFSYLS